jgi:streptogramin lyase
MSMIQRSATLISVLGLGLLACTVEEATPTDGSSGSSGADPTGMGGTSSGDCPSTGTGTLDVQVSGLPTGILGDLVLTGPGGALVLGTTQTLSAQAAGPYTLTRAERVADTDPVVRTLFDPTPNETQFCLKSGASHSFQLAYAAIPTSHRLWTNTANGSGNMAAFSGSVLGATASAEPSASLSGGMGKDVAFDTDGNLWTMGATLAEPHLMRFSAAALGSSGAKEPDRSINIAGDMCLPALNAFAFDPQGSLWVALCGRGVIQLKAADLTRSGDVSASVAIASSSEGNTDLAFDAAGNLWVANEQTLRRYDASRLSASSDEPADLVLHVQVAGEEARGLAPYNLLFNAAGDLWLVDFGGNLLARVPSSNLSGRGEQTVSAAVTLALPVGALLDRPAFDESGALWIALEQGRFGRLAPAQLNTSTGPGEPTAAETVITSSSMGYANRMAFFPAAAGLPLFHHFR